MKPPEPEIVTTFRTVCAERPTFAAMALTAIHDRDAEITRLRAQLAAQTIELRIWRMHAAFPIPRPALTSEHIERITAAVIDGLREG